jgi:hypothetical protein
MLEGCRRGRLRYTHGLRASATSARASSTGPGSIHLRRALAGGPPVSRGLQPVVSRNPKFLPQQASAWLLDERIHPCPPNVASSPASTCLTYHHKSAIILPKGRENKTQSEGPECRSKTRFLQHPLGFCLNPTFWRFLGRATMPLVKPGTWAFFENSPFTLSPSFHACYRSNPQAQKARKGPVFPIAHF